MGAQGRGRAGWSFEAPGDRDRQVGRTGARGTGTGRLVVRGLGRDSVTWSASLKLRLTDRAALARHSPLGACLTVESAVCRAACGVRAGRAVAPSEEARGASGGRIACPVLRAACPPGARWLCVRAARITPPLRVASVGSVCLRLCS